MSGTFVTVYTSEPDTMKMKNYNIQRRGVLIMKCIGIIGAMEQEVAKIKEKMQDVTITSRARMDFYEGTLEGKKVVVVRSGIGKVNAGMCTQILADVFGVEAVINTGIAGSLNNDVNIGILFFPQMFCIMIWMRSASDIRKVRFRRWMNFPSLLMKNFVNWLQKYVKK